jgi:L,D-transpeptidase catalytic domain
MSAGAACSPRALAGLALTCVAVAAGAPIAAIAAVPAPAAVVSVTQLSNERTLSRWAYPLQEAIVRIAPSDDARALGRLRFLTGDGQAQIYLVLASAELSSGAEWVRIEFPGRPNGRSGWVPRGALAAMHVVREYLRVDRGRLRATLFRDGKAIFSAPVGVGKASTQTPAGSFFVVEKLIALDAPVYGPYAIGTSAYAPTLAEWPGGGIVGIHGTNEPQLIPGRPSHGCIRMRNADITRLWHLISVGTPIQIV